MKLEFAKLVFKEVSSLIEKDDGNEKIDFNFFVKLITYNFESCVMNECSVKNGSRNITCIKHKIFNDNCLEILLIVRGLKIVKIINEKLYLVHNLLHPHIYMLITEDVFENHIVQLVIGMYIVKDDYFVYYNRTEDITIDYIGEFCNKYKIHGPTARSDKIDKKYALYGSDTSVKNIKLNFNDYIKNYEFKKYIKK